MVNKNNMMRLAVLNLSSTEALYCYEWVTINTQASHDPASLTWFVGCNFLWSAYANAAMASEKQPLIYADFEAILKIVYGGKIKRQTYHHTVAVVSKSERRKGRDGKEHRFDTYAARPHKDLIFSGIRYLKDGVPVFGL